MPPCPPELTKPVEQYDERSTRAEVFSDGNVEAHSVGRDIAMLPWAGKQDVAYSGPCHGGTTLSPVSSQQRSGNGSPWRNDFTLDLRCLRRRKGLLRSTLNLGRRKVGLRDSPVWPLDSSNKEVSDPGKDGSDQQ